MRSKLCMLSLSHLVWNELVELFVNQFIFNTMIDVILRDLEVASDFEDEDDDDGDDNDASNDDDDGDASSTDEMSI